MSLGKIIDVHPEKGGIVLIRAVKTAANILKKLIEKKIYWINSNFLMCGSIFRTINLNLMFEKLTLIYDLIALLDNKEDTINS